MSLIGKILRQSLAGIISRFAGKNAYLFGDSVTFGHLTTRRWSTSLCLRMPMVENNFGLNSSALQNQTPHDPGGALSMIERIGLIPTYSIKDGLLVFSFGINDFYFYGSGDTNFNVSNFIIAYNTVIDASIANGWPLNKILILTPSYLGDAVMTGGRLRSDLLAYNAACLSVAIDRGIMGCDIYTPMAIVDNPLALLNDDEIHPIEIGDDNIATTIFNFLINS